MSTVKRMKLGLLVLAGLALFYFARRQTAPFPLLGEDVEKLAAFESAATQPQPRDRGDLR